ncbi:ADP-ribosylglycohydrolase family protein [Photobacterium leiognathi]|uniref:ADP-ribosylglycohydrolase family protein n=1 Tax=Photobacterium leiognathi TaxID=553611 RepID=UPI0029823D05|nr:ADP-ribosylglycohydrolase family protein [Photobacterium leiognathi]
MTNQKERNTVNSALWAAYADALGFMTELADSKMVSRRTGKTKVVELVDWTRKIGGMYGPLVSIPAGAYSDDTQLRLATSRAINRDGYFSINAFSKIELPIWSAYALGAGVGSKIAASSLAKRNVAWYNNFYQGKSTYINSGGNGAVMRIQPHVWASQTPDKPESFLSDVIKNSLTTHGHPRAIAGSVFHALSLSHTISVNRLPSIEDAIAFNEWTREIPRIIKQDINLSTAWVPIFENEFGKSLENAYEEVYQEINELLVSVGGWYKSPDKSYDNLVNILDLKNTQIRGSGTLTAVAATAAALIKDDLMTLLVSMVNALGTDTDSIATMVGAIRGIVDNSPPPQNVQDQAYIINDAERLFRISIKTESNNYQYPDIIKWKLAPSTLDYVVNCEGELVFPPFGVVTEQSEPFSSNNTESYDYCYQWVSSKIGQSFLVKKRNIDAIKSVEMHQAINVVKPIIKNQDQKPQLEIDLLGNHEVKGLAAQSEQRTIDIDILTSEAIASNFDPKVIGTHLIDISHSDLGVNGAIAYSAIISKALSARKKRHQNILNS